VSQGKLLRALQEGEIEQRLLREAPDEAQGNVAAAARRLGLTRAQLAYRLKQAGAPEAAGRRPGDGLGT
jgi:transcriptional regulator with GAF, ATPase, and Fis domain